jgi:transcriptional regulator with XRE-family HTH domain
MMLASRLATETAATYGAEIMRKPITGKRIKTRKINGRRIKALRQQLGLNQEAFAEDVGVVLGTVSRWERGQIDRVREQTLTKICSVLKVSERDISDEGPLVEREIAQQEKRQMNLSVSEACRNALHLVALRYEVTRQQIVELAPLLFFIAAEQSLQMRRKRLDDARDAASAVLNAAPPHLALYCCAVDDERALDIEERSIKERDLFGTTVFENVGEPDDRDWDEGEGNPFASFLSDALRNVSEPAESVRVWGPPSAQASYEICGDQAAAFVGGNADAVRAILQGKAALHNMPEIGKSSPAERAEWACAELERSEREARAELEREKREAEERAKRIAALI